MTTGHDHPESTVTFAGIRTKPELSVTMAGESRCLESIVHSVIKDDGQAGRLIGASLESGSVCYPHPMPRLPGAYARQLPRWNALTAALVWRVCRQPWADGSTFAAV